MKKIISILLFLVVLGSSAYAETVDVQFNSVHLVVNNQPIEVPNILYNGTTYVPLRAVSETLNMKVNWDESTWTASIMQPSQTETEANLANANNALKAYKDAVYASDVISTLRASLYEMYSDYLRVDDIYDNYISNSDYRGIHYVPECSNSSCVYGVSLLLDESLVANRSLRTACTITGYNYENVVSLLDYTNKAAYYFDLAVEELRTYREGGRNPYNLNQAGTYLSTGYNFYSEVMDIVVEMDNALTEYVLNY